MSEPLREISGKYLEVIELAQNPDIPMEAIQDTLEGIEGEFNDKADSVLAVLTDMDGDVEKISSEIKRLQRRKNIIENGHTRLKDYLRMNMEATEINKITCTLFTITLKKAGDIVVIDDEDKLPDEYVDSEVITTPKKREILAALKEKVDIPGAHMEKAKRGLMIK